MPVLRPTNSVKALKANLIIIIIIIIVIIITTTMFMVLSS